MTANVISTPTPDFISTLSQAAAAYREGRKRPTVKEVVNALLQAEKNAKQQRINYPFESLVGQWLLCFVTGTKKVRQRGGIILGKGLYVPKFVPIHISFNTSLEQALGRGEIANQVQLGSLVLQLTGPVQYLGKKKIYWRLILFRCKSVCLVVFWSISKFVLVKHKMRISITSL